MLARGEGIELNRYGSRLPMLCHRLKGRVSWKNVKQYRIAFVLASGGAIVAAIVKTLEMYYNEDKVLDWLLLFEPEAYTSFTFLLGFMIAFRTNQAYQRHWEGVTLLQNMMGNWYDAASSLVAFCRYNSGAKAEEVADFQHILVRLLSLMNALIFCELGGSSDDVEGERGEAMQYKLLDVVGLDVETLRSVMDCDCRPELAFQKVQCLIVDAVKKGVLSVPPPLLTRSFQEMSNAMLNFHEASKLANVPFPGSYAAATHILISVHIIMTPMVVVYWTRTATWCAIFSFVLIFIMNALITLASGLDNPFDPKTSELDLEGAQILFNNRLACLMREAEGPVATLTNQALTEAVKRRSPLTSNTPRATVATATSLKDLHSFIYTGAYMTALASSSITRGRLSSNPDFEVADQSELASFRGSVMTTDQGDQRGSTYVVRGRPPFVTKSVEGSRVGSPVMPSSPQLPDAAQGAKDERIQPILPGVERAQVHVAEARRTSERGGTAQGSPDEQRVAREGAVEMEKMGLAGESLPTVDGPMGLSHEEEVTVSAPRDSMCPPHACCQSPPDLSI